LIADPSQSAVGFGHGAGAGGARSRKESRAICRSASRSAPRRVSWQTTPTIGAERGAQMRLMAEGVDDPKTRAKMLKIADEYEKLAKRAKVRGNGN